MKFKRNQVEEAISAVLEPRANLPSPELRIRLKRLLDADRIKGRQPRSSNPESANYAFYSAAPPGRGVEVQFSSYETFAILTGLQILAHGWPQGLVVTILRGARPELEKQHARILLLDEKELFDEAAIRAKARPGDFAFDNTAPVLLTIVSKVGAATASEGELLAYSVCDGVPEAMKWLVKTAGPKHGPFTMFELVSLAHALAKALARIEPRPRGRAN